MTDREIMEALVSGKTVKNAMNIFLRLNPETGRLESRAVPHDPDWIPRRFFNEMRDFTGNPDVISRGQYAKIVDETTLAELLD